MQVGTKSFKSRSSRANAGEGAETLPVLDKTVGGRLIVVSNRLPVTISRNDDGTYNFKLSSGGLVSALSGCKKQMDFTWIGWPGKALRAVLRPSQRLRQGLDVPMEEREGLEKRLNDEYQCSPVYLSDEIAERHYNGFSNSILWPLFHYRAYRGHSACLGTEACAQTTRKCCSTRLTGWLTAKPTWLSATPSPKFASPETLSGSRTITVRAVCDSSQL
jgi:hypothetical protein